MENETTTKCKRTSKRQQRERIIKMHWFFCPVRLSLFWRITATYNDPMPLSHALLHNSGSYAHVRSSASKQWTWNNTEKNANTQNRTDCKMSHVTMRSCRFIKTVLLFKND